MKGPIGAQLRVPMAPRVARELELHFQRSGFSGDADLVFPNTATGLPQQRSEVRRKFERTLKRAGLRQEMKFHGLRHTFATRLAASGVPLVKLQEWLGHEDAATTQIYVDFQPSGHDVEPIERAFGSDPLGLDRESAESTRPAESTRRDQAVRVDV